MATDDILRFEDVVAGYGKMTILHGLSLRRARGAITTVIGPNGAGKSTVFKAAFGMLPVRAGRIFFDGARSPTATPRQLIAAGICYVPQGRNIFPELSVLHNLELGGVAAPKRFDLPPRIEAAMDRFPVLRSKARQQASTLSGGEQKMLEVARGLLLDPKLMLIDEPSIGLSPILVEELFGLCRICAQARHDRADDRAERQARARDLRLRHRARGGGGGSLGGQQRHHDRGRARRGAPEGGRVHRLPAQHARRPPPDPRRSPAGGQRPERLDHAGVPEPAGLLRRRRRPTS